MTSDWGSFGWWGSVAGSSRFPEPEDDLPIKSSVNMSNLVNVVCPTE